MTPDTNLPSTITVTVETDQFDPTTQHYITAMLPKVIPNPALSCSARFGDVVSLSTTITLVIMAVALTWLVRGWLKK